MYLDKPNLNNLSDDIIHNIAKHLYPNDNIRLGLVCKRMSDQLGQEFWKLLYLEHFGSCCLKKNNICWKQKFYFKYFPSLIRIDNQKESIPIQLNLKLKDNSRFTQIACTDLEIYDAKNNVYGYILKRNIILDSSGRVWQTLNSPRSQDNPKELWRNSMLPKIKEISCSDYHFSALDYDGKVWFWSNNFPKQIKTKTVIKQIRSGPYFDLFLDENGDVWGRGDNTSGQLGFGDWAPTSVAKIVRNPFLKNIVQIETGVCHSLVLTESGKVYGFGGNKKNQLDMSKTRYFGKPFRITCSPTKKISVGNFHNLLLDESNKVLAFGDNTQSQLNLDQQHENIKNIWALANLSILESYNTNIMVFGNDWSPEYKLTSVESVSSGWNHSMILGQIDLIFPVLLEKHNPKI